MIRLNNLDGFSAAETPLQPLQEYRPPRALLLSSLEHCLHHGLVSNLPIRSHEIRLQLNSPSATCCHTFRLTRPESAFFGFQHHSPAVQPHIVLLVKVCPHRRPFDESMHLGAEGLGGAFSPQISCTPQSQNAACTAQHKDNHTRSPTQHPDGLFLCCRSRGAPCSPPACFAPLPLPSVISLPQSLSGGSRTSLGSPLSSGVP
jgi:hypothetical protein